jgi:hypothetical protein
MRYTPEAFGKHIRSGNESLHALINVMCVQYGLEEKCVELTNGVTGFSGMHCGLPSKEFLGLAYVFVKQTSNI